MADFDDFDFNVELPTSTSDPSASASAVIASDTHIDLFQTTTQVKKSTGVDVDDTELPSFLRKSSDTSKVQRKPRNIVLADDTSSNVGFVAPLDSSTTKNPPSPVASVPSNPVKSDSIVITDAPTEQLNLNISSSASAKIDPSELGKWLKWLKLRPDADKHLFIFAQLGASTRIPRPWRFDSSTGKYLNVISGKMSDKNPLVPLVDELISKYKRSTQLIDSSYYIPDISENPAHEEVYQIPTTIKPIENNTPVDQNVSKTNDKPILPTIDEDHISLQLNKQASHLASLNESFSKVNDLIQSLNSCTDSNIQKISQLDSSIPNILQMHLLKYKQVLDTQLDQVQQLSQQSLNKSIQDSIQRLEQSRNDYLSSVFEKQQESLELIKTRQIEQFNQLYQSTIKAQMQQLLEQERHLIEAEIEQWNKRIESIESRTEQEQSYRLKERKELETELEQLNIKVRQQECEYIEMKCKVEKLKNEAIKYRQEISGIQELKKIIETKEHEVEKIYNQSVYEREQVEIRYREIEKEKERLISLRKEIEKDRREINGTKIYDTLENESFTVGNRKSFPVKNWIEELKKLSTGNEILGQKVNSCNNSRFNKDKTEITESKPKPDISGTCWITEDQKSFMKKAQLNSLLDPKHRS